MTDQDDAGRSSEEGIEPLYESLGALVLRTLIRRFAVPPREAQKLLHDIFFEYVTRSPMVDDPKECLMAMTAETAWTWRRRNGITAPSETGSDELLELRGLLRVPEALAALPERVREMARLRIEEQRTYPEIAAEMGVSAHYAEAALKKACETLRKIARSRGE